MTQLHLLPSWNAPWAVLQALAHITASSGQTHHVAAWRGETARELFDLPGVSTMVLGKRWPWDPVALWRWWRLLGLRAGHQVHLWGGLAEGAAATLVAAGDRTTLHVLDAGNLRTLVRLEQRGTASAGWIELPGPWLEWARQRFPRWHDRLGRAVAPSHLPVPSVRHDETLSPLQNRRLERLLAGGGPVVLGYHDGRSREALKRLLWAADILCSTCASPVQFCFTGPRPPDAATVRFWAALRTRRRICWQPWPVALAQVLPKAALLWWNDAEDLTLLLPRAALQRRLPVAGWTRTLEVLRGQFPGQVACVEKDAYSLASVSLPLLRQAESSPRGALVPLELGTRPS